MPRPSVKDGSGVIRPPVKDGSGVPRPSVKDGSGVPRPHVKDGSGVPRPSMKDGSGVNPPSVKDGSGVLRPSVKNGSGVPCPSVKNGSGVLSGMAASSTSDFTFWPNSLASANSANKLLRVGEGVVWITMTGNTSSWCAVTLILSGTESHFLVDCLVRAGISFTAVCFVLLLAESPFMDVCLDTTGTVSKF